MTKAQKKDQEEARTLLREKIPPGSTLYTIVTHVSRSGMSRSIRCFLIKDDSWDISHFVARALGDRIDQKNGGVKVGGCGMDMGFHIANNLSYALHGLESQGEAKDADKQGRPYNQTRPGHYRAGYSINHRWL